jgi:hypothetical protein
VVVEVPDAAASAAALIASDTVIAVPFTQTVASALASAVSVVTVASNAVVCGSIVTDASGDTVTCTLDAIEGGLAVRLRMSMASRPTSSTSALTPAMSNIIFLWGYRVIMAVSFRLRYYPSTLHQKQGILARATG